MTKNDPRCKGGAVMRSGESFEENESYYLAYGLFGIFMKWARSGYAESV